MALTSGLTSAHLSTISTRFVDRFARLCYWLHETRRARLLLWLLTLFGVAALLFARPGRIENALIRDYKLSDISLSTQGTWVRVAGRLAPEKRYQTRYALGSVELRGSRFIPLSSPESSSPLFVLEENVPAYRAGEVVSLVGQVMLGEGEQPPIYLELGVPPNVVLANLIAQAGVVALVVSLVFSALAWLVHFSNYALPVPLAGAGVATGSAQSAAAMPRFLWYGDLGKEYGDVVVREVPCEFDATVHEARFVCQQTNAMWKVSVRHLRSAQLLNLATQYGGLPAARILFEDERGLMRHAVFAANSPGNRDHVLRVMSLIR